MNCAVIKPFDSREAASILKNKKAVFTVEEHSVSGGLGSILCEVLAENRIALPIKRIGLENMFALGYGTQKMVRTQNKLDAASIAKTIEAFIAGIRQ